MLGHLIHKEILDHISSFRFLILSALGGLVIWLSLYDGYAYYLDRLRDYRVAQSMTRLRLSQLQTSNWEDMNNGSGNATAFPNGPGAGVK